MFDIIRDKLLSRRKPPKKTAMPDHRQLFFSAVALEPAYQQPLIRSFFHSNHQSTLRGSNHIHIAVNTIGNTIGGRSAASGF